MKLVDNKENKQMRMGDLKDGEIAVITEKGVYEGYIIQRIDIIVITLGMNDGHVFTTPNNNTTIRKLKNGELLEVTNND